ncbi:MAG: MbcA/ParS/Xre antitoxin family protein [Gammaproteobacteria bacterium]
MARPLQLRDSSVTFEALGAAALQAFFGITRRWRLSAEDERILLGNPPRSTFFKWKKDQAARLSNDVLERISYVMGIYKALQILLPDERAADDWPAKPNSAPLFNGRSALEKMRGGRVVDLADVRRYLDAERG